MDITEKTCAERIGEELKRTEIAAHNYLIHLGEEDNEDIALSAETTKMTRVCFSWGGPSDYLEIEWVGDDLRQEIQRVVYRFSDWFDTATVEVQEGSPLYAYAEMVLLSNC